MITKIKRLSVKVGAPCLLSMGLALVSCDLQTENPNSLVESDLEEPAVAAALANGAMNTLNLGAGFVLCPNSTVSDEVTWIGSRDAWGSLDKGQMSDVYNEFVDYVWPYITEARWMCDKAVSSLEGFKTDGTLEDDILLARAYLYAGAVRCYIADSFEDFVYSDKTISGEPIVAMQGKSMSTVYDEAVALFQKGLSIAEAEGDTELEARFLGMLARATFSKEALGKLAGGGFVSASTAAGYAEDALVLMDDGYKWQLEYSSGTVWNELSWQINGRSELEVGVDPGTESGDAFPEDLLDTDASVHVIDLLGNDMGPADPRLAAIAHDFFKDRGGTDYAPITVTSAAEMYLILAEANRGNAATALDYLNNNRTGMTAYTTSNVNVDDAIKHERRVNLFLSGRRLTDMYRFGETSSLWEAQFEALSAPGTLFPITIQEIRANENVPLPGG